MKRLGAWILGLALLATVAAGCTTECPTYNQPVGSEKDRKLTGLRRDWDQKRMEILKEQWEDSWMYGKKYQNNPVYPGPYRD